MGRVKHVLLVLGAILLLSTQEHFLRSVRANTMVTGTVFCDACKDGERSFFDYPLSGAKVAVACGGADGAVKAYEEDGTNWFGSYAVYFDGTPDLSGCYARVVGGPSGCDAAAGPARALTLLFRMFGMAMYAVEPLLSEPQEPMGSCPRAPTPTPALPLPPPPAAPKLPVRLPTPIGLTPPLLPPPLPQLPLLEASACPFEKWMMQEYKCYWRVVSPDTRVAIALGPLAGARYGMDMTLWEGLQGRGDLYRTLLREGTASLLNSYNSLGFFYPTLSVMDIMNRALLGSQQEALTAALRFRRANSGAFGAHSVGCNFSPCNS